MHDALILNPPTGLGVGCGGGGWWRLGAVLGVWAGDGGISVDGGMCLRCGRDGVGWFGCVRLGIGWLVLVGVDLLADLGEPPEVSEGCLVGGGPGPSGG